VPISKFVFYRGWHKLVSYLEMSNFFEEQGRPSPPAAPALDHGLGPNEAACDGGQGFTPRRTLSTSQAKTRGERRSSEKGPFPDGN
jgi:hypothetical protein